MGRFNVEYFYKKPYQTWQTEVKTLKNLKMLQQEHTKEIKYYYVDL